MRAFDPLRPVRPLRLSAPSFLAFTLACGCGGAPPRPAANADFGELQRAEASVVEALAIADSTEAPCEARCEALEDSTTTRAVLTT